MLLQVGCNKSSREFLYLEMTSSHILSAEMFLHDFCLYCFI